MARRLVRASSILADCTSRIALRPSISQVCTASRAWNLADRRSTKPFTTLSSAPSKQRFDEGGQGRREYSSWGASMSGGRAFTGAGLGLLVFGALERGRKVAHADAHAPPHAQQTVISGDSALELEEQAIKIWAEVQRRFSQWANQIETLFRELLTRFSEQVAPYTARIKSELSSLSQFIGPKMAEAANIAGDSIDAVTKNLVLAIDWVLLQVKELLDKLGPRIQQASQRLGDMASQASQQASAISSDALSLVTEKSTQLISQTQELLTPAPTPSSPPAAKKETPPSAAAKKESPSPPATKKESAPAVSDPTLSPAAVAATSAAAAGAAALPPPPPSTPPPVDYYVEYGPWIVGGTCLMAVLGFYLSRAAIASMAERSAPAAVKPGAARAVPHKRRATAQGPLQANELCARMVREALPMLASSPKLSTLGAPLLESRLVGGLAGGKGGRLEGEFNVKGPNGHAKVHLLAHKGVVVGLTVTLEDGEKVELSIVTDSEKQPPAPGA